jgi:hypothetical protein
MALYIPSLIIGSITGLSVASNLTINLISASVKYSVLIVSNFMSYHHIKINEVLDEYDLISKLQIIEAIMKDINDENIQKESVKLAINNVHNTIDNINKNISQIDQIINNHKQKYFSNWRYLNYDNEIYELKRNIKLLDIRYQMLLEISNKFK